MESGQCAENEQINLDKPAVESGNSKEDESGEKATGYAPIVAAHYNALENPNLDVRNVSRIFHLRNFNNWIKAMLIKESTSRLPDDRRRGLKVLDMCCGKGGDLKKWQKGNVKYLICADIAETSLEQCETRYKELQKCFGNGRNNTFECEFIHADCTRVRLRGKFRDPSVALDIVSCQFSFHYCFESLPQVECMLKNASDCLRPGGLFIGTMPNANEIVKKIKKGGTNYYKNDVFSIEMGCTEPYPLFGAKYNFYLEGVVNCPEFLVHFPTLEKLAKKYGFKLVHRELFSDFFNEKQKNWEGKTLLKKMKALETYPPAKDAQLFGPEKDYIHARVFHESNNSGQVGTMSMSEWDVISLYQTFIFQKIKTD